MSFIESSLWKCKKTFLLSILQQKFKVECLYYTNISCAIFARKAYEIGDSTVGRPMDLYLRILFKLTLVRLLKGNGLIPQIEKFNFFLNEKNEFFCVSVWWQKNFKINEARQELSLQCHKTIFGINFDSTKCARVSNYKKIFCVAFVDKARYSIGGRAVGRIIDSQT